MSTSNTQIEKDALLWWDSLENYEMQRILIRNHFTGTLVTTDWIIKCYKAEHPSIPVVSSEEKEYNFTSDVMNDEYLKLKSHVAMLRDALNELVINTYAKYPEEVDMYNKAKSALEQTKQ